MGKTGRARHCASPVFNQFINLIKLIIMATATKIPYLSPSNSVNLMTVETVNSDNKAYIVDKRLVDHLLSRITTGKLHDIKCDLKDIIEVAETKEQLFAKLDDYLYLDKVIQLLPVEEETADNVKPVKDVSNM